LLSLMVDPDSHMKETSYWSRNGSRVQPFEKGDWNYLDLDRPRALDDPHMKAIHYTRMSHQVQLKHALPRLARQGRQHWFKGQVLPNDWPGLQALFDGLLAEAYASGYSIEQYMQQPLFGKYSSRGG
jgi:hypothetical protein